MASTTTAPTADQSSPPQLSPSLDMILLRGPIIIAGTLFSLLYPILKDISMQSWIRIVFILLGLAMTVLDVSLLAKAKCRSSLRTMLNSIVLDDILRALFDKEGLFAVIVSTFVGNAAMYNFVNEEQRTRLVGACFGTHQAEADTILHTPGGVLKLFPDPIQEWVNTNDGDQVAEEKGKDRGIRENTTTSTKQSSGKDGKIFQRSLCPQDLPVHNGAWDDASESCSSNESSSEVVGDSAPLHTKAGESEGKTAPSAPVHHDVAPSSDRQSSKGSNVQADSIHKDNSSSRSTKTETVHPLPRSVNPTTLDNFEDVLMSVMKEVMSTSVKNVCEGIPDRSIKAIGITASVALMTHMRYSPRARKVFMGVIEGITAFGIAGVALTSIGTLIAKRMVDNTPINPNVDAATTQPEQLYKLKFLSYTQQRIWTQLQQIKGTTKWKKWRNFAAMLIILYIGKMRRNRRLPGRNATQI